jgi:hypothetical protein
MYVQFLFFRGKKSLKKYLGGCRCRQTDLRKQFLEIARGDSPEPRAVYSFMTTAIVRALPMLFFFFINPLHHRLGHASDGRNSCGDP